MKLYSSPISPYASRVRIQIHHKKLPVEIAAPPGGFGSAELKLINPTGRIPVLDLGDTQLAESWAIMEFLETKFPQHPMLASDPVALARQRELVRFCDIYLAAVIVPMFRKLRGMASDEAVAEALKSLDTQLGQLERFLARRAGKAAFTFDLTDAALLPVIWYCDLLAAHFGKPSCLDPHATITRWYRETSAVPACAKVLAELETGLRAMLPALFAKENKS